MKKGRHDDNKQEAENVCPSRQQQKEDSSQAYNPLMQRSIT
jgi:hypothetical protein